MDHKSTNSKTQTNQIIKTKIYSITFLEKFLNIQNNFLYR